MKKILTEVMFASLLAGLLIFPTADFGDSAPATSPAATAPASADLSSPLAAYRTLWHATLEGNVPAADSALIASDQDKAKFEAAVHLSPALSRVVASMKAKFSDSKTDDIDPAKLETGFDELMKKATQTITGDTATLADVPGHDSVQMKKVGDDWKLDSASSPGLIPKTPAADIEDAVKQLNKLADDIDSGKAKSSDDAQANVEKILGLIQ